MPHAFCSKNCTIEGNLGLSDLALRSVKDNAVLGYCLHKLHEMPVMFLRGAAIDANVMYGNNTREMVCYLVPAHLKDVLGHLQAKRYAYELVPATMSVKSGQVQRLFIEANAPEAIFSVQLTEACSTVQLMRNLLEGRDFIVLSLNDLV